MHLAQQDLFLEEVVASGEGYAYVVGWGDEPDWEREQRKRKTQQRARPRRPSDPLFQGEGDREGGAVVCALNMRVGAEYTARKKRHEKKVQELMQSKEYREFAEKRAQGLLQLKYESTGMVGERKVRWR